MTRPIKYGILIVALICLILAGCRRSEPYGSLDLNFQNATSANIRVVKYKSPVNSEISLFSLEPQGSASEIADTYGGEPSYQGEIVQYFISDSIIVYFNDSLKVVHLIKNSTQYPEADDAYLGAEESGNIANVVNYNTEYIDRDAYRATYTFTQQDLDYAIAINE